MARCHAPNHSPLIRNLLAITLAALALCYAVACKPDGAPSAAQTAPVETYFPIQIGDKTLQLQVAVTLAEQQKGLMHRDELETDNGMLFLFEAPGTRSFWMKNTRIPLDIGYFDSGGRLLEIHRLYPYDETPVDSRSDQILIAIETNQGWYQSNGIKPDAQLDMDALKAALSERGFNPAAYPLDD